MSYVCVRFDTPPSANKIWRKGPAGMHLAPAYRAWKAAAGAEVMIARKHIRFVDPVSVMITCKRVHKGRDLDNSIKPILDVLQFGQLLENDNIVESISVWWAREHEEKMLGGRDVCVEVRSL